VKFKLDDLCEPMTEVKGSKAAAAVVGVDAAFGIKKFCDGRSASVDDDNGGICSDTARLCGPLLLRFDVLSLSHFSCCNLRQSPCCCCCRCSDSGFLQGLLLVSVPLLDDAEEEAVELWDPSLWP